MVDLSDFPPLAIFLVSSIVILVASVSFLLIAVFSLFRVSVPADPQEPGS
jgi:hypothetical protein